MSHVLISQEYLQSPRANQLVLLQILWSPFFSKHPVFSKCTKYFCISPRMLCECYWCHSPNPPVIAMHAISAQNHLYRSIWNFECVEEIMNLFIICKQCSFSMQHSGSILLPVAYSNIWLVPTRVDYLQKHDTFLYLTHSVSVVVNMMRQIRSDIICNIAPAKIRFITIFNVILICHWNLCLQRCLTLFPCCAIEIKFVRSSVHLCLNWA